LFGKPENVRESLTAVKVMSGILLKVREMSGKSGMNCLLLAAFFASILDFADFVYFILVSDHALLHSYLTTDNNTSTGMI